MAKTIESLTKEAITWVWGEYCNELERLIVSKKDLQKFTEYILLTLIDEELTFNPKTKEFEIVEKSFSNFRIQAGKWYMCTQTNYGFQEGKLYHSKEDDHLIDDSGINTLCFNDYVYKYFRPSTPEEIPHNIIEQTKVPTDTYIADENGVRKLGSESKQEELNELEKAVLDIIPDHNTHTDSVEEFARRNAKRILSVARKQLQPEIDAEIDKAYKNQDEVQYKNGYNKAVDDACEWLKDNFYEDDRNVVTTNYDGFDDFIDNFRKAIKGE